MQAVAGLLEGRRVLVTGSGGSIGSELCRQILRCQPRESFCLGTAKTVSSTSRTNWIAAWRDCKTRPAGTSRPEALHRGHPRPEAFVQRFKRFQPEVIFHAAAHKHVPLMEENPCEGSPTTCLEPVNLLSAADAAGVERFVMISTDKAVNPSSVMGQPSASRRCWCITRRCAPGVITWRCVLATCWAAAGAWCLYSAVRLRRADRSP